MLEISASSRQKLGRQAKTLRNEGVLPAVLYGPGLEAQPLEVSTKEFQKILSEAGETSLVSVKVKDGKSYSVLIHDVSRDPITLAPLHADFFAVRMDKPIEAKVPLEFVGEAPAEKAESAIIVKVLHELEVKALPKDLPNHIEVDISVLEHIDAKIHVSDIKLPQGVSTQVPPEEVVVIAEAPRSDEELAALESTGTEAAAEVKTEQEVKAEEKAAKEAEEAATEEKK